MGATFIADGVSFALFSAHATKVEVCTFDESGEQKLNGSTTKQQAHGG
jgi:glycogen operon protein